MIAFSVYIIKSKMSFAKAIITPPETSEIRLLFGMCREISAASQSAPHQSPTIVANRDFNNSIVNYGYYVDFKKVYKNVDKITFELNI